MFKFLSKIVSKLPKISLTFVFGRMTGLEIDTSEKSVHLSKSIRFGNGLYTNFTWPQALSKKVWVIKSINLNKMTFGNRILNIYGQISCASQTTVCTNFSKKIDLKTDDSWEFNLLPGMHNTLYLSSCKHKYTFDLNLGRYKGSKSQNPPFYLRLLADTSSVKFVYNVQKRERKLQPSKIYRVCPYRNFSKVVIDPKNLI